MSSLLREAIVDAKALRETALKAAESTIVEKYSDEVRQTLEQILEQEELPLTDLAGEEPAPTPDLAMGDPAALPEDAAAEEDIIDDVNLAATDNIEHTDGIGLKGLPAEGETTKVIVSLDALQEAVSALEQELEESQEFELNEEDIINMLSEDEEELEELATGRGYDPEDPRKARRLSRDRTPTDDCNPKTDPTCAPEPSEEAVADLIAQRMKKEGLGEDLDGLVDAIAEKLEVDMGAELTGWAGNSQEYMKHEVEREMAHRRSTDVQEELEDLKKAQEELVFENKKLKEQNKQYKQATNELKESLQDVNLSNARLLYTNRVLRNTSLNERQKETIVEAISRAGSVTEARMILDTLQSTAQSTPQRGPQSLSEALNRRSSSSVIRASRQEKTDSDPFSDRMKRLAGIK
jgi:hypothetical protein